MTASLSTLARYLLAASRIVNGGLCLVSPPAATRKMGVDPDANPAALYALRLFGIRTVLIGAELLFLRDDDLERSFRTGLLIHGSDAAAAMAAGAAGQLPPATARKATTISAVNIGLCALALSSKRTSGRR